MRISLSDASRLIRHDRLLISNQVQLAFRPWYALLVPLVAIPLLFAIARNGLSAIQPEAAFYLSVLVAFSSGCSAARAIGRRLEFLRADSVVASDALRAREARRYAVLALTISGASIAMLIALLWTDAFLIGCIAVLAGILFGGMLQFYVSATIIPRRQLARLRIGSWLRQPVAGLGLACAFTLIVLTVALRSAGMDRLVVVTIAAFLFSLPLTHVDFPSVRFMASCGLSCWRSIRHHLFAPILFVGIVVPVAFLAGRSPAAGMVAGLEAVLLLMIAMRVLAYRIVGRRVADAVVSILLVVLLLVAFSVPIALPVAVIIVLWWLVRRARRATWLIA